MTREGFADVRRLTNEALTIDPEFTLAKALGAYIRSISVSQCWHEPDDIRVAVRMAREVLAEARDDPTSLRFAAQVLAYLEDVGLIGPATRNEQRERQKEQKRVAEKRKRAHQPHPASVPATRVRHADARRCIRVAGCPKHAGYRSPVIR
jgi:hypothetical protein